MTQPIDPARKNSTRWILISVATGLLFLLTLSGLLAYWLWDQSRPLSKITVSGQATNKIKPDLAKITFYYSESGTNLETLNQNVDKATTRVKDYLKQQGIDGTDLVTNKNAYPDYSIVQPAVVDKTGLPVKTDPQNTKVEVSFQVSFKNLQQDTSKPNKILQEVTKLGVNRFDSLTYDVGDRTRLCADLQTKAIEDGYKRGEDQIKALGGGKIVRRELQTGQDCNNAYPPYYALTKADAAVSSDSSNTQSTPPDISAGEQELSSQVSVVLEYR